MSPNLTNSSRGGNKAKIHLSVKDFSAFDTKRSQKLSKDQHPVQRAERKAGGAVRRLRASRLSQLSLWGLGLSLLCLHINTRHFGWQ